VLADKHAWPVDADRAVVDPSDKTLPPTLEGAVLGERPEW